MLFKEPPLHASTATNSASSAVSEASLVRLALSALQGVESAVISVGKFSAAFCSDPADRTLHQIPSLWNRSSSTHALGNILNSIGCSGFLVFLLFKFVDHFTNFDSSVAQRQENQNNCDGEVKDERHPPYCLVNQAFAVAVGKVLEGYVCALDTLHASVGMRRSGTSTDTPLRFPELGCLTSVVHSEITLLEVYLHTKELRTQVEALGNICNLHHVALCFSASSFEDLTAKAALNFRNFFRGGDLLTFLYTQLQLAGPAHRALLKFLFLRSCEPYCGFIRSWIFKAEISDPYNEFVVEYSPSDSNGKIGTSINFPLANIRERERADVPCFLKNCLIPLVRAGQQLQVLMKLFELCNYVAHGDQTYSDIFPSWSSFSANHFSDSPITFSKGSMESLVLARNVYYKKMQENLESNLKEFKFSYEQVAPCGTLSVFYGNDGGNSCMAESFTMDDSLIIGSNLAVGDMDSDELTTEEESSSVVDFSESSDFSSLYSLEDETETELPVVQPDLLEQKYLSALSFSKNGSINGSPQEHSQSAKSCHQESDPHKLYKITNHLGDFMDNHLEIQSSSKTPVRPNDSSSLCKSNDMYMDPLPERAWPLGGLLKNPFYNDSVDLQLQLCDSDLKEDRDCYSLSKNPMLAKNPFFNSRTESGERCKGGPREALRCFYFSTVEDPCNAYLEKLDSNSTQDPGNLLSLSEGIRALAMSDDEHNDPVKKGHGEEYICEDNSNLSCIYPHQDLKEKSKEDFVSTHVSGGASWQSLLSSSRNADENTIRDQNKSSISTFEVPLDFIIEKCLLQEILLQYEYVSKLTIKLLEQSFDLHKHMLALRRYHFMEVADWVDLFILSIWNHNWCVSEADQRISEIQGILELSVQRSSCEKDPYKDRLFAYVKKKTLPLSTSGIGLHSFDFLGLGYRVDWPVSIVLTPDALKIYAEIFSFLVQVKLAVFSLNDVWSSLKELKQSIHQNHHSDDHEVANLNKLMKMRHQVNHFVCTLQQYVLSQLSDVSWCRFLHSLKHKVKDMMDFEAVHLAHLTDSLHICFLSDETRSVATIIESILQCALDFRSCLSKGIWHVGPEQGGMSGQLTKINISQMVSIKQSFERNMKELHLCYLKAPKHVEFGLPRFWRYLNYNDYYSDFDNEIHHFAFLV